MKKLMKWIAIVIGFLIVLGGIAFLILTTLISPNRYKPFIAEQVEKYTGHQLVIDGDISWTLFPYFGVKVGHVVLNNPPGFQQKIFADIGTATVGVKILPLLKRKIESNGVTLDQMTLNLIKNASGKTNWEMASAVPEIDSVPARSSSTHVYKSPFAIAIAGIHITNATITWVDEQHQQMIELQKFSLNTEQVSFLQPFSIASQFSFASKKPLVQGYAKLTGEIAIDPAKKIFTFRNLDLITDIQSEGQTYPLKTTGDVVIDLNHDTLNWDNFQAKSANLTLDGKIHVVNLQNTPEASGHLVLANVDLREWLKTIGKNVDNIQVFKDVSGNLDFSASAKQTAIEGKLKIDSLQANRIMLTHVNAPLRYQNGIATIGQVTGDFYQGQMKADVMIDMTAKTPKLSLDAALTHFLAEPLLNDLGAGNQPLKFTGTGDLDLKMTTTGDTQDEWMNYANGSGHFSFDQGVLKGIDIPFLIHQAASLFKKQNSITTNNGQTDFGHLTGSFTIKSGVLSNQDLLLTSTQLSSKGRGTIRLNSQEIDYRLQTTINAADKNDISSFYGLPIPIMITGNLQHPKIQLDSTELARSLAKEKMQTTIEETIKKNKLPEKANRLIKNLLGH